MSGSEHCRFGGRAMLDPGTAWPECGGVPLSLFAVLDLDVLARPGLAVETDAPGGFRRAVPPPDWW
ncbi:hypothetical protein [Actinomadura sp. WAC 06369]|uniref:hypothetical protein n=1 Tax=Actinomadura sp. WAC 06369 TaxID=2203193 RepID=UPI000F76DDA4|nr:hypothetical protein [Actinomadura sp. WAC 06369]